MIRDKIKSRKEIARICRKLQREGKKVGFTSGSFDLIHAGHALYLEKARKKCDVLVVGVNSDKSVKKYKGADRPIISQSYRIKLIAGLDSVDYCFLFDERRNAKNIETIRLDYYIKAADYTTKTLTSAEVVKKHGGKVVRIPLEKGLSTSTIIKKILGTFGAGQSESVVEKGKTAYIKRTSTKKQQTVFVDRDGTINEDTGYPHEPKKFKILPNVIRGLKHFQNMGLQIVIITNQAGIGLGYFTIEDFYRVNSDMLTQFSKHGITISKIYFCPHSKIETCDCRKPRTGLIKRAAKDLNLDLKHSYFIGDMTKDIKAGKDAGCTTILVKTGHAGKDKQHNVKPDFVAKDLLDAATWIKEQQRR